MSRLFRFQYRAIVRAALALFAPNMPWTQPNAMVVGMNAGADYSYSARRLANLVQSMGLWTQVTAAGGSVGAYSNSTAYATGMLVSNGGATYRALQATTGHTPPNATYWAPTTYVPYALYTGAAGTWSQNQGTLYSDGDGSGTDGKYFRATIASNNFGLPSTANGGDGLYIVLNPCGLEIAIGTFGSQALSGGFRTDKYFTFTYPGNNGAGIDLWFRGHTFSNTGAGNVQIVPHAWLGDGTIDTVNGVISAPGTSGYTSGNPWNPDFITFYKNLGAQHIRWMAASGVNGDTTQDWADRVLPTSISFQSPFSASFQMPFEYIVDFSNRTGIDPWINLPVRATPAFIAACANVFKGLNANQRVLPEDANETWNYAGSFGVGTAYMAFLQYTKHIATPSDVSVPGAPVFLAPSHGRSVGDVVQLFSTRENTAASMPYYVQGNTSYTISAVADSNHFTLNFAAGGHTVPAGLPNIEWCWQNEPGVSNTLTQANINAGLKQLAIWDAFDAALGASRVVHSIGSQAVDASHTTGRVGASAGTIARTEFVHVAPYYSGLYWTVQVNGGGGSITPRVFNSVSGTAWYGVYASGSTPTSLDVVNQSGTGFVAGGGTTGQAMAWSVAAPQPALPTATGLTDGTNYAIFVVFQEAATGYFWKIGTGTDAQNPSNVVSTNAAVSYLYDTYANQAARARANGISTANYAAHTAAITGVGSSAQLITYEGGADYNLAQGIADPIAPAMFNWLIGFLQDATAVATMRHNYNHLARLGYKSNTYYMDNQGAGGGTGVYDFATGSWFADQSNGRYTMLAAFSGAVPHQALIPGSVSASQTAAPVTSAPGYPATVASLTAGYTHSIVSGDWTGNFSISGLNLVMNNGTEVNFSQYAPRTLTIEAADSYSSVFYQLTVPLGSAWWPADSQFVWDSVGASAGTTMVPPGVSPFSSFGSALTEITGTGNPVITSSSGTVSNDVWKLATYVFGNGNAMTQTIQSDTPFLVAHIADVGDQTATFQYQFGIGAGANSIAWGIGSAITSSRWRVVLNGTTVINNLLDGATNPAKGTKVVHWIYVDPVNGTAIAGQNQTAYSAGSMSGLSLGSFSIGRDVRIGSYNGSGSSFSQMYHGSAVVLSRSGLTQTQALAIVQGMQTHHGI